MPWAPSFLLVDPLDGTKEFLAGRDEFTVNVAIVTQGVPIAGIIAAPAQGLVVARRGRRQGRTAAAQTRAPRRPKPTTAASSAPGRRPSG